MDAPQRRGNRVAAEKELVMENESKVTTDHKTIQEWVQERGGHPACIKGTGGKHDPGLLRIDFPGYRGDESLEEIAWDEFFKKFDEAELAFVYQEEASKGQLSRFCKLVDRSSVEEKIAH